MIKRFFAWLKSIYFHPVEPAESQPKEENIMKLSLVSIITSQLADGLAANRVLATLTDDAGVAQPGAAITFTADNGATGTTSTDLTDLNGQITVSLVSSIAGSSTLTAQAVDGTTASIQVYFVAVPAAVVSATVTPAVADEVKASVADFEAALSFVESGVAQLGDAAKDELKELAKKYL